jgi:hypothetical protein
MARRMTGGERSRSKREPSTMPEALVELCAQAEARATAHGHVLTPWRAPVGDEAIARAADCGRCARGIYARAEGNLMGLSGTALTEPCDA